MISVTLDSLGGIIIIKEGNVYESFRETETQQSEDQPMWHQNENESRGFSSHELDLKDHFDLELSQRSTFKKSNDSNFTPKRAETFVDKIVESPYDNLTTSTSGGDVNHSSN